MDGVKKIGENLKKYRKNSKFKFTQQAIANLLDVNIRTYQSYENGKIIPPIEKLIKIADTLDVTLGELTGEKDTLKDELELKNCRLMALWAEAERAEKSLELGKINEKIKTSNNADELRDLFNESKKLINEINYLLVEKETAEDKIKMICAAMGLNEFDLKEITYDEEEEISYINHISFLNSHINAIIKDEHKNEDITLEQIIDGKLDCYKELFTDDLLGFLGQAISTLHLIKLYIANDKNNDECFLNCGREQFARVLACFYSHELIGLDRDFIEKRLFEIMDKK